MPPQEAILQFVGPDHHARESGVGVIVNLCDDKDISRCIRAERFELVIFFDCENAETPYSHRRTNTKHATAPQVHGSCIRQKCARGRRQSCCELLDISQTYFCRTDCKICHYLTPPRAKFKRSISFSAFSSKTPCTCRVVRPPAKF